MSRNQLKRDACDAAISRIHAAADLLPFGGCDLIIEAATENEAAKRKIFGDLSKILMLTAILATNTSSIPITRLAVASSVPERFIGLHFMNPVPAIKLVEIIRGRASATMAFCRPRRLATFIAQAFSQDHFVTTQRDAADAIALARLVEHRRQSQAPARRRGSC